MPKLPSAVKEGSLVQRKLFNDSKDRPRDNRKWDSSPYWWRSPCCDAHVRIDKVDKETGAFTQVRCSNCKQPCDPKKQ